MGYTSHDEQFLLKAGGPIGCAEFIGAAICEACGIPACTPAVVSRETPAGEALIFGSRIEAGVHKFDQSSIAEWNRVISGCNNTAVFSAMFAIDLALGNDDRHWGNWLVQEVDSPAGVPAYRMRALDFSRSWPKDHPAQHPMRHRSRLTWMSVKQWSMLGVNFDIGVFHSTCARIGSLSSGWLYQQVLRHLPAEFADAAQIDEWCEWWHNTWNIQVIEAIDSLEHGVRP